MAWNQFGVFVDATPRTDKVTRTSINLNICNALYFSEFVELSTNGSKIKTPYTGSKRVAGTKI